MYDLILELLSFSFVTRALLVGVLILLCYFSYSRKYLITVKIKENILEVKDLHVDIHMTEGLLTAVRGVNFEMKKGETKKVTCTRAVDGWR